MKKIAAAAIAGILIASSALPAIASIEVTYMGEIESIQATASAGEKPFYASLYKGLETWAALKGYTALFTKEELDKEGNMDEKEEIYLKFEKPFKIFMKWMNTRKKGLQVLYERGRHGNKLGIHKPGLLLGLAQVVFLDQNSPWVREGSAAYNIEDAGIGTFLTDFAKGVVTSAKDNKIEIKNIAENEWSVTFKDSQKGQTYFAQRIEVKMDAANGFPVVQRLYNWDGKRTGIYEYKNIKIDAADEAEFKKQAHGKLYKIYQSKPKPGETLSDEADRAKPKAG
jgi:hypothetical protein